ncbi:hypothetical protein [Streptomyces sp. cg2]|uniref:hypothetical protein n=1 Tax=Streptomyces sp. cg2 TaxID=3238799 RepID=UPI0034E2FBBB
MIRIIRSRRLQTLIDDLAEAEKTAATAATAASRWEAAAHEIEARAAEASTWAAELEVEVGTLRESLLGAIAGEKEATARVEELAEQVARLKKTQADMAAATWWAQVLFRDGVPVSIHMSRTEAEAASGRDNWQTVPGEWFDKVPRDRMAIRSIPVPKPENP